MNQQQPDPDYFCYARENITTTATNKSQLSVSVLSFIYLLTPLSHILF